MRILWFTNTPSLYQSQKNGYNGGGWIASLESLISKQKDLELGVGFFLNDKKFKEEQGKTTYYPIYKSETKFSKYFDLFFKKKRDQREIKQYLDVINDFNPDIIHIFGTELSFGNIIQYTKIPVVIHIQGILNPCLNAYYAPGMSIYNSLFYNIFRPWRYFGIMRSYFEFKYNAQRELNIYKNCKYFLGRTDWDKNVSILLSGNSHYFYCSEVLREPFYVAKSWNYEKGEKLIITSTVSMAPFKGFDLILKTAKLLKDKVDFIWMVYGISQYNEWQDKLDILAETVNIKLMGVVDESALISSILSSNIFVHPSYIDNSSNSVCEAQLLGIPVISTNVGGIPSLIEEGKTGFLVPANDPYQLASKIIQLFNQPELAISLSNNSREIALKRHDRNTIINDLLKTYNDIL